METTPAAIVQLVSLRSPTTNMRRGFAWVGLVAALTATMLIVEQRPNRHHELAVALLGAVHNLVY